MHFATIFAAAAAALASTASASPIETRDTGADLAFVILNTVARIAMNTQTKKDVRIPIGKLTHFDSFPISELYVDKVEFDARGISRPNIDNVMCQRYNNQFGTEVGSARFTKKSPGRITTKTVDFGWVLCYVIEG